MAELKEVSRSAAAVVYRASSLPGCSETLTLDLRRKWVLSERLTAGLFRKRWEHAFQDVSKVRLSFAEGRLVRIQVVLTLKDGTHRLVARAPEGAAAPLRALGTGIAAVCGCPFVESRDVVAYPDLLS